MIIWKLYFREFLMWQATTVKKCSEIRPPTLVTYPGSGNTGKLWNCMFKIHFHSTKHNFPLLYCAARCTRHSRRIANFSYTFRLYIFVICEFPPTPFLGDIECTKIHKRLWKMFTTANRKCWKDSRKFIFAWNSG